MQALQSLSDPQARRPLLVFLPLLALAMAAFSPRPASHGGGHTPPGPPPKPWDGPGDTNRPRGGPGGGGGGGGSVPGPSAPGAPGPAGPSNRGGAPSAPGAPSTLSGAGADATDWRVWWELERHAFLALRDALASVDPESPGARYAIGAGSTSEESSPLRPDDALLLAKVRPALLQALAADGQPDVVTSALTALAKLGTLAPAEGGASNEALVSSFLAHSNQQVSETAALALGILGAPSAATLLASLLRDDEAGRERCGRASVPERTRAFAAIGLGQLAQRAPIPDQRRYAVHELARALTGDDSRSHDVPVACFNALAIARLPKGSVTADDELPAVSGSRDGLAAFLGGALEDRKLPDRVRAHLPRALASVSAGDEELARDAARRIVHELGRRRNAREVRVGCVQALGLLGTAGAEEIDQQVRAALFDALADGGPDVRGLALIALGRVAARPGGDGPDAWSGARAISDRLATELARGKGRNRPWAALALGVQGHALLARGLRLSEELSAAVRLRLRETGDPLEAGACALALGLRRDVDSIALLVGTLERLRDDGARGAVALGLGLMGESRAQSALRALLDDASYRPLLMRPLVTALALLRDPGLVPELVALLDGTNSSSMRAVYAYGLAFVGDRRAVGPLAALLVSDDEPALTRGNAALGLGWISERTRLPWKAELASGANYLAAPESLWSPQGGGALNVR